MKKILNPAVDWIPTDPRLWVYFEPEFPEADTIVLVKCSNGDIFESLFECDDGYIKFNGQDAEDITHEVDFWKKTE